MITRRVRASAVAAGLLAATLLASGGPATAAPGDPAHSWGGFGFTAGQVCDSGTATSPLASWDLGGGLSPGFLAAPVMATAGIDSAVPPIDTVGAQTTTAVTGTSGSVGSLDPAQVAPLAALLSRYGASTDDATVAALAHLAMSRVQGNPGISTDPSLPLCADPANESQLSAQAQSLAGPYTVTFTPRTGQVPEGQAQTVAVTVTGAAGTPVPGVTVTFSAASPLFDGGSTATARATTDAAGQADVPFTVPAGTATPQVQLTASVSVATTLTVVQATATPTPTDPSGGSVPALVAGSPAVTQATQTLVLDRSAHPVLTVAATPAGTLVGNDVTPTVIVTGLNGHHANVVVTTAGPLPLRDGSLCSTWSATDFAHPPTGSRPTTSQDTVPVLADGTIHASPWTASSAGCYWVSAVLTTTDATPAASASATIAHPVVVLDTLVDAGLTTPVTGRGGAGSITVRAQNTHGATLSVDARLTGPVLPLESAIGCTGIDYTGASTSTVSTDLPAQDAAANAATDTRVTIHASGVGCTRVAVVLVVHTDGTDLRIAVPLSGTSSLLAIAPTVAVTLDRGWGQTGEPVTVSASVGGAYGQAGHLTVHLMRTASSPFGCRGADFADATAVATGPAVPVTADFTPVQVHSATLGDTGCYQPVAVLQMDAAHTVTAASTGDPNTVLGVGIGPSKAADLVADDVDRDGGSTTQVVLAILLYVALLAAAIGGVLRLARDSAREARPAADDVLQLGFRPRPRPTSETPDS